MARKPRELKTYGYAEMSFDEIGELIGCDELTARRIYSNALKKIRVRIKKDKEWRRDYL